jgi:hypothetical protein
MIMRVPDLAPGAHNLALIGIGLGTGRSETGDR